MTRTRAPWLPGKYLRRAALKERAYLGSRRYVELRENVGQVPLDGLDREKELVADLLVGHIGGHKLSDSQLSIAERLYARLGSGAPPASPDLPPEPAQLVGSLVAVMRRAAQFQLRAGPFQQVEGTVTFAGRGPSSPPRGREPAELLAWQGAGRPP
jgi:hypothetical protein